MKLGKTTIEISKQGLGCMSMSEFYGQPLPEEEAIALINDAYKNGRINLFYEAFPSKTKLGHLFLNSYKKLKYGLSKNTILCVPLTSQA